MKKHENAGGYFTPIQQKPIGNSRFINTRKIEHVPGFDLGTPHKSHISESCRIFRALKYSDSSILSPVLESSQNKSDLQIISKSYETEAYKILDAPDIVDDFYLNLLSWGSADILAVALRGRLYLRQASTGHVSVLTDYPCLISSVCFLSSTPLIALGLSNHALKIIDIEKSCEFRTIQSHTDRISALACNNYVLSSGSRDSFIINHDLRTPNYFVKYHGHSQEVCGLRWNSDLSLLASGSNDNKVCVWDLAGNGPLQEFTKHKAAVKAVAWCPWNRNWLATGGGSMDKCIKVWDVGIGKELMSKETGSAVSGLEWNREEKALISSHGMDKNEVNLWESKNWGRIAEFLGHTGRILGMCLSSDEDSVVTAGADETIRFWKVGTAKESGKNCSSVDRLAPGYR